MSRIVRLGFVLAIFVIVISVEGTWSKPGSNKEDDSAQAGRAAGSKASKPGKKRSNYQKIIDDACTKSSDCDIYKGLDCHPKTKKCVCVFSLHSWDKKKRLCVEPGEETSGEDKEPDPIDVVDPEEVAELDDILPPPEDEKPSETRRRRKIARAKKALRKKKKRNLKPKPKP